MIFSEHVLVLRLLQICKVFWSCSVFCWAYSLRITMLGLDGLCGDIDEYWFRLGLSLYRGFA